MKILVVDDHPLFRNACRYLLRRLEQNITILEANNLVTTLGILTQHTDLNLILLDLNMPGTTGLSAFHSIREQIPHTPIIIISASEDMDDIRQAIQSGVSGYIPKSTDSDIILNAVKLVLAGGIYLPEILINPFLNATQKSADQLLSQRQKDILSLVEKGLSNKEIAQKLNISEETIKKHIKNIFQLLQVNNRMQAVIKAIELGEITK